VYAREGCSGFIRTSMHRGLLVFREKTKKGWEIDEGWKEEREEACMGGVRGSGYM